MKHQTRFLFDLYRGGIRWHGRTGSRNYVKQHIAAIRERRYHAILDMIDYSYPRL